MFGVINLVEERFLGWIDIHADDEDVTCGERHGLASLDGETGCTATYVSPFAIDLYRWRCDELVREQGLVARQHGDAVPHTPDMRGGANSIADGKEPDVRECLRADTGAGAASVASRGCVLARVPITSN